MATIKSYTDIKQSKKLAEILPIESADMWYSYYGNPKYNLTIAYEGKQWFLCHIRNSLYVDIPCWSLAALLGFIPNYKLSSEHNYHTCTAETSFGEETVGWFDSPVDACYEMILKLKELKLLFAK